MKLEIARFEDEKVRDDEVYPLLSEIAGEIDEYWDEVAYTNKKEFEEWLKSDEVETKDVFGFGLPQAFLLDFSWTYEYQKAVLDRGVIKPPYADIMTIRLKIKLFGLYLFFPLDNSSQVLGMILLLEKKFIRKEIVDAILLEMKQLKKIEIKYLVFPSETLFNQKLIKLLENNGMYLLSEDIDYTLEINHTKWNLVELWIDNFNENYAGFKIEFHNEVRPKYVSQICELLTNWEKEMKNGLDLTFTPKNYKIMQEYEENLLFHQIFLFILTPENEIIGITSVTSLNKSFSFEDEDSDSDNTLIQRNTIVKKSYRNKGIAKALKALMLKHIQSYYSEVKSIETGVDTENKIMQSINKKLGFKKVGNSKNYVIKL